MTWRLEVHTIHGLTAGADLPEGADLPSEVEHITEGWGNPGVLNIWDSDGSVVSVPRNLIHYIEVRRVEA